MRHIGLIRCFSCYFFLINFRFFLTLTMFPSYFSKYRSDLKWLPSNFRSNTPNFRLFRAAKYVTLIRRIYVYLTLCFDSWSLSKSPVVPSGRRSETSVLPYTVTYTWARVSASSTSLVFTVTSQPASETRGGG